MPKRTYDTILLRLPTGYKAAIDEIAWEQRCTITALLTEWIHEHVELARVRREEDQGRKKRKGGADD